MKSLFLSTLCQLSEFIYLFIKKNNQALMLQNFLSCSTKLSMKSIPLINVKMPTVVGILTFMSRITFMLS